MFQYLNHENVFSRFEASKTYTDSLTTRFPEFARIADAKPRPGMPKHLPKNVTGDTASVVQKTPRRAVQQLPTGTVHCDTPWLGIVATYIAMEKISKNANGQYELLEKCWQTIEGSLTRGFSPWYCPFIHSGDYIGPDYIIPWWGDIYVQPGKLSDSDSNYLFLRSWWREEDIDALIDRISKMDKDDVVDSGWDVAVLKEVKTHEQTKDNQAQTPTDKAMAINQRGGIELIIGFQRGVGSKFITFHRETHKVARTKTNKDPRGDMPMGFNYFQTNGTNPFGRGMVELVAPLQNLMDSDDVMYQFNRALMLAPPIKKRGSYSNSQLLLVPNQIIDLGTNEKNDAEPLEIDSTAIANYPALYQLNQSRLYNLLSAPNNAIPTGTGGIQDSKTDAGVKSKDAVLSVDDNFVRKKFEASYANWMETGINLWFAMKEGIEELQLDEQTAAKLRNLPEFNPPSEENPQGGEMAGMLSEDNKIRINYDDETEPLYFQADFSSSQKQTDQEQVATMTGLLQTLEKNPALQGVVPQDKIREAWNTIVAASGAENVEDLRVSDEEFKEYQAEQQQKAEQQMQMEAQANQKPPEQPKPLSESITLDSIYKDVNTPAEIKAQILGMIGLEVSPAVMAEMQATEQTTHMSTQAENLGKIADVIQTDPEQARHEEMDMQREQFAAKQKQTAKVGK